jgi:hypothetical protein
MRLAQTSGMKEILGPSRTAGSGPRADRPGHRSRSTNVIAALSFPAINDASSTIPMSA